MNCNRKNKIYMSEINLAPLIDVMLVLLVVFMITAPMLVTGVSVELPKTKQVNLLKDSLKPVVISLNASGEVFIGSDKVTEENLLTKLKVVSDASQGGEIFIRGDKNLRYETIMMLMGKIINAGFEKVSLVTEI